MKTFLNIHKIKQSERVFLSDNKRTMGTEFVGHFENDPQIPFPWSILPGAPPRDYLTIIPVSLSAKTATMIRNTIPIISCWVFGSIPSITRPAVRIL